MIDLTPIINGILAVLGLVITTLLIPYIKSKLSAEQRNTLSALIQAGVKAAEQIYVGSKRGAEKKQYVIDFLKKKGYTIFPEQIDPEINTLIESAVFEITK